MQVYADRLEEHLQTQLQPLYLVFGDDDYLRLRAIRAIREKAAQLGFNERLQFNQQHEFDWAELTNASQNLSLFSERRCIEIELPTASPGVDGSKALHAWTQAPPSDILLVLHGPKLKAEQQRSKWFKALEAYGVFVPVYTPEKAQLARFITQVAGDYGLALAPDAMPLLQAWFEGNLLALDQTLQKIALTRTDAGTQRMPVDAQVVKEHAELQARFDIFALQDPLLQQNFARFIQRLQRLIETDAEPVLIHWLLQRHCSTLNQAQQLVSNGEPMALALQKQGVWKQQHSAYSALLKRWSPQHRAQSNQLLLHIELALKRDSQEDVVTLFGHLGLLCCSPELLPLPVLELPYVYLEP